MSDSFSCNICSGNTISLTPVYKISELNRLGWENDSTMKLLGLEEVETQLRICPSCLHSTIFPRFDGKQLYGERGLSVRKEIYELYFPEAIYGKKSNSFDFKQVFSKLSIESLRSYHMISFIAKRARATFREVKEIRILDWGGGDGYVSEIYSNLLKAVTGLPVVSIIYDYTDWKSEPNRAGIENLKHMDNFHLIILSHVLEHTHHPVETIKSALRFLKDDGLIVCEVPDERLQVVRAVLRRKVGLHYHVAHFSRRSLHKTLEKVGLGNIYTSYQHSSSYRGSRISCIVGIAQKGGAINMQLNSLKVYEAFSLVIFLVRKIFLKFLRIGLK
jgi:hypothetical protein